MGDYAPLLAGFAIIGTVCAAVVRGWSSIKASFSSFIGIFISRTQLTDEATSQVVLAHLVKTWKRSMTSDKLFGGKHESFRDGKFGHVPFEFFGGTGMLFWNGWLPLFYTITKEAASEDKTIYWGGPPKKEDKALLTFIRGTVDVEKLVKDASEIRNNMYWSLEKNAQRRFFIRKIPSRQNNSNTYTVGTKVSWFHEGIYRLLSHEANELGCRNDGDGSAINQLFFPDNVKGLIEEVRLWHNMKDWYRERHIPWKRGWVLYGPPGTGKTALIRAIAEDLDMPLFVFSLGELQNQELQQSWQDMQVHVPCIALCEDFDNVFHGRTNVYGKPTLVDQIVEAQKDIKESSLIGRLSFDCLLNCIDGVDKANGVFFVITTNQIDKLDPALGQPQTRADGSIEFVSSRPGRIDKAIELGYMMNSDKLKLARRIFLEDEEGFRQMQRQIEENPNSQDTPAQFQERCAQLALKIKWQQSLKSIKINRNNLPLAKRS